MIKRPWVPIIGPPVVMYRPQITFMDAYSWMVGKQEITGVIGVSEKLKDVTTCVI